MKANKTPINVSYGKETLVEENARFWGKKTYWDSYFTPTGGRVSYIRIRKGVRTQSPIMNLTTRRGSIQNGLKRFSERKTGDKFYIKFHRPIKNTKVVIFGGHRRR
jgi:hypothetical protein